MLISAMTCLEMTSAERITLLSMARETVHEMPDFQLSGQPTVLTSAQWTTGSGEVAGESVLQPYS